MKYLRSLAAFLLAISLAACVQQVTPPATARPQVTWPFEASDVPVDTAFRFGKLDNGLRYVIRQNTQPAGTALVRMVVDSGSLAENEEERGYAHFVEHMAFNGSTNVPEGEMIKLLERKGLAFGADTNASTGFERTTYKLDLPRNDPELLATALMLMRETASELTFSEQAVERERGVVLAEMRDRNTYVMRELEDRLQFTDPDALYVSRLPIGTTEALNAANGEKLRAFWQREYVPANTTLTVIGDFAPDLVEAAIRERFADWAAAPLPARPDPGPVDPSRKDQTDIYIDPALSERVSATRNGRWLDEPDSVATRRENLLRQIGYAIVNRRLERLSRQDKAPFRSAGFGTGKTFKAGRATNLIVDVGDGEWRRGLVTAAVEYRRALKFGFTEAEVAEQLANIRTATENAAASTDTRSNGALTALILNALADEAVPSTPQNALERFLAFMPEITPDKVLAALKREAVPLDKPLLRFRGRKEPEGGAQAIRAAWNEAMATPLERGTQAELGAFAYTDFGEPGTVVEDETDPRLGIREIRFANGLRLNLKSTALEKETIRVELNLDGGRMLDTRDNPLATAMIDMLPDGGLGKHSQDDLQSILAGRSVGFSITAEGETFTSAARTTPRDLELQLMLLAAALTDPGYRPEGEENYRRNIANYFARKDATPTGALASEIGGILSDKDPRFTLQPQADYRALTFARLRDAIGDRFAHGAIELALIGDLDEEQAIALVAKTLGAIPARETEFQPYAENRARSFTSDRRPRVIRHTGPADQALLRLTWPTRDDSDPVDTLRLQLLERIVRIELTDTLREKLGKAYSPQASSTPSRHYRGYGTFDLTASVDVADIDATRQAIEETIARLRASPVDDDMMSRARQPLLESYDNMLKTNLGWLVLADRAQSRSDRIDRYLNARKLLESFTGQDIQAMAQRYLGKDVGLEVLVLPKE